MKLIKNDINLYSAHTNLDSVEGGINDTLMSLLGINEYITMEHSIGRSLADNKSWYWKISYFKGCNNS